MARTTTEHVNAPFGSSGPSTAETLMPFACSGFAACFASCVIHPIDLAKVRLQLFATQNPGVAAPNFVSMIGGMVKQEGFASIYAGLSASLLRHAVGVQKREHRGQRNCLRRFHEDGQGRDRQKREAETGDRLHHRSHQSGENHDTDFHAGNIAAHGRTKQMVHPMAWKDPHRRLDR